MESRRGRVDAKKTRCDRCQTANGPVSECAFRFSDFSYLAWKALWEQRHGARLTNRRKQRLIDSEEAVDLRECSRVIYWMDLCPACWEECSAAREPLFPLEFWEHVLRCPARIGSAESFVPTKTQEAASPSPAGR